MRIAVLAAVATLALAITGASQPASLVTKTVSITATAFTPTSRTIATTDAIKWTNKDTKSHQVVANNGSFVSPTIAPGKSYTHTFNTAGTFNYHDALHPSLTGKIIVNGPPPAITIGAAVPIIDYGQSTHISGVVSNAKAGETVTVYAQPFGQASPVVHRNAADHDQRRLGRRRQADAAHDLLGALEEHGQPADRRPAPAPSVVFGANKRMGSVKVKADRSLTGKKVYLQKFDRFHEWVKVRSVVLGSGSAKRFLLGLPRRPSLRGADLHVAEPDRRGLPRRLQPHGRRQDR